MTMNWVEQLQITMNWVEQIIDDYELSWKTINELDRTTIDDYGSNWTATMTMNWVKQLSFELNKCRLLQKEMHADITGSKIMKQKLEERILNVSCLSSFKKFKKKAVKVLL